MRRPPLYWQILIALLLALAAGVLSRWLPPALAQRAASLFGFLGTLFLQALKLLAVPLVIASIIHGMAGIGSEKAFGRLGLKTLLYYTVTTSAAVFIGLAMANLLQPGWVEGEPARERIGLTEEAAVVAAQMSSKEGAGWSALLLRMVPPNLIAAAAEGQILGLIAFSLLFGYFMSQIEGRSAEILSGFWKGLFEVMMRLTEWVMRFLPIGVFGLVAQMAVSTGLSALRPLTLFMLTVLAALAIHSLLVLPALLRLVGGISPVRHFKAMAPALLTAFSTSSSSATLPITLDCLEQNARLSNRTTSFVIPLGATVNMDGTALYECVAVLFIAQAYGIDLGWAEQITVVFLALATSVGVAGIPAASLVAIVLILGAVGLPPEGLGMILAVDRILDMCRTGVNVLSDTCGAVIIGRSEGETPYPAATTAVHPNVS